MIEPLNMQGIDIILRYVDHNGNRNVTVKNVAVSGKFEDFAVLLGELAKGFRSLYDETQRYDQLGKITAKLDEDY
jgi:hypothetical protein